MQTRIDKDKRTALYFFESLAELAKWCDETPRTWGAVRQAESNGASERWDLNAGFKGAWDMARWGWLEGAKRAQEALVSFPPMTPRPEERTDFYGHRPHVARYCSGAPDSMIRHAPSQSGAGKVLTLAVPVTILCSVDAPFAANFGIGLAQYIFQMENQGIRVEVIGVLPNDRVSNWRIVHSWRIKYADQPLDLAVLAFAVGHPAMFRRLGFALLERSPATATHTYGYAGGAKLKDLIDPPPGTFILNGMGEANKVARTPKDALAYITKQIEKTMADPEAAA